MRKLELLAPAKNIECGKAAIDCGADAVYIGAPKFGARQAAGNSLDDIRELTAYAHQFSAKVFVTLNTLIYDDELDECKSLLRDVIKIGVDAILVQDMALVDYMHELGRTKEIRTFLHASTQTDNRNKEKVGYLRSLGFSRVVLARELTLDEIREIHEAYPDVELEAFVHGALCVSYSGACYVSEHCFGRSANRGECAQFCRMKFDLIDADGNEIEHQRHLLSLKDMCQIDRLEQMADAGVVSFKIEGRLKDISYVKNVVAAYSQRLDELCRKRPDDYCRASIGKVSHAFTPDLAKTFNRGYTHYFLDGRKPNIFSPDTPKAMGEYVGKVKEIRSRSFNVAGVSNFANGDGLCFINAKKELEGFRVNKVEGNRLFPLTMPEGLRPGVALYRNNDVAFDKELTRQGTERRIPIRLTFAKSKGGFSLYATGRGIETTLVTSEFEHQLAQRPQRDNIIRQLSKWGASVFYVDGIDIEDSADECFIPSSLLSSLRQTLASSIKLSDSRNNAEPVVRSDEKPIDVATLKYSFDFKNISNSASRRFYEQRGNAPLLTALEVDKNNFNLPLMQCRHCLRFSSGYCVKHGGRKPEWKEPLSLRLGDGRMFQLEFDCKNCQMNVLAEIKINTK